MVSCRDRVGPAGSFSEAGLSGNCRQVAEHDSRAWRQTAGHGGGQQGMAHRQQGKLDWQQDTPSHYKCVNIGEICRQPCERALQQPEYRYRHLG